MIDRNVNKKTDTMGLIFSGAISFIVGLLFFIPGIYLTLEFVDQTFRQGRSPDLVFIFLATFPVVIGLILLFLSINFFTGNIENQNISRPVLLILSVFFLFIGSLFVVLGPILNKMQNTSGSGRGIGASLAFGFLCLWLHRKRGKTPNKKIKRME